MTKLLAVSHPDDLTIGSISSGWLMGIAGCHPDDFRYSPISSGWHNVIWNLSHPDEFAPGRISSGWLLDTAVCHPCDISHHRKSSGWLSRNWYIIRMSYDNVIMSSGWHTHPLLSHPDEIANFDFAQHALALQRFRTLPTVTCTTLATHQNLIATIVSREAPKAKIRVWVSSYLHPLFSAGYNHLNMP